MVGMCLAAGYRLDKEPDLSLSENRAWVSGRTRSWVFWPDLSFSWPVLPFSWPDLSVFVAESLFVTVFVESSLVVGMCLVAGYRIRRRKCYQ
jgi:hypothetical protein